MKVEIEESTATIAFAWGIAIYAGEEVDEEGEEAIRDLGQVIAPQIDIDNLIEAIKVGTR